MSESSEQIALFEWAAFVGGAIPELSLLFAVPNGGARSKATAARLKNEGVKAGVPDLCLPVRTDLYGALWIELKRPGTRLKPKGRVSEAQKEWLGALQAHGQCAAVCFGWGEARDMILAYLRGEQKEIG